MPAPSVTEIRRSSQLLTAAQILALNSTGLPVTPAPGASQLIIPQFVSVIYNFGTFDFGIGVTFDVQYQGYAHSVLPSVLGTVIGQGGSTFEYSAAALNSGNGLLVAGALGKALNFVLTGGTVAGGGISAASITAAGTGYVVNDTGTITTGNGDATYRITSVGALGAVTGFVITFPGSGYATGAGQATATGGAHPGVGINFTVNVTGINNGDGTIKVVTLYQIIDVP